MSSRSSNSTTLAVVCVSLLSLGVLGYCIYGTKTKTVDYKGFKEQKADSLKEKAVEVIGIIDLCSIRLYECDNIYVRK
jgi:hypothetical protein